MDTRGLTGEMKCSKVDLTVKVVPFSKVTKNQYIVHWKWVNFMIYKMYLNRVENKYI